MIKRALLIFTNNHTELLITLITYMFIYNLSLIIIFWTLFQFLNNNFKTLYAFADLKWNFFFLTTITITFFSLAGVPPFLGFFPKLLILISLINSNFFFFYIFFFSLLFLGLYFYIQNIRYLHTTANSKINYSFNFSMRSVTMYYLWTSFFLFFLLFGVIFFDDFLFYFYWLIN